MPPAAPPVLIDTAPSLLAPRYGLLSAGELVNWDDPHLHNGFESIPNAHGVVGVESNNVDDHTTPVLDTDVPTVVSGPIRVYAGLELSTLTLTPDDAAARARARLSAGEVAGVEKQMWADADHPLTADPAILSPTAVSMADAVGLIEDWFGERYGGTPVIHAPRQLGARARAERVAERDGQKMVSALGSVFSFGNYPGTGPLDVTDPENPEVRPGLWLVASGQVQIRRSDVVVLGADQASRLDRRINQVRVSAHRTYVVSWDGITAAVPITTS